MNKALYAVADIDCRMQEKALKKNKEFLKKVDDVIPERQVPASRDSALLVLYRRSAGQSQLR